MSDSSIPPQSYFFHSGKWTAEIDIFFLTVLTCHKKERGWTTKKIPEISLVMAELALNKKFETIFTSEEVSARLQFMELRYKTFKKMCLARGVLWDALGERIIARPNIWDSLFRVCAFSTFLTSFLVFDCHPTLERLSSFYFIEVRTSSSILSHRGA